MTTSYELKYSTLVTTTSVNYTRVGDCKITPAAGKYLVSFSGEGLATDASSDCNYTIFLGGLEQIESTRSLYGAESDRVAPMKMSLHTQALLTVDGNQTISVRWKTSKGVFKLTSRSLILIKV